MKNKILSGHKTPFIRHTLVSSQFIQASYLSEYSLKISKLMHYRKILTKCIENKEVFKSKLIENLKGLSVEY